METGGRGALKWVRGLPQYESSSSLILVSFSSIVLIWRTLKACLLTCFSVFFFWISLEFPTTKTSDWTRHGTMYTSTFLAMPCTYPLVFFLNSQTLTAVQPLHRTYHTGQDINTSHHFLLLACSRLPQDVSIESNTIPLPNVSCHPFYLHAKWITNQQPPIKTTHSSSQIVNIFHYPLILLAVFFI